MRIFIIIILILCLYSIGLALTRYLIERFDIGDNYGDKDIIPIIWPLSIWAVLGFVLYKYYLED